MNQRVPVYLQPVSSTTQYLPTPEYSTLSSLNLPMNSDGIVLPLSMAHIPLGYRIVLPAGCIGVMKERRSAIEDTPFIVMAGILDCNTMREDSELESKKLDEWPPKIDVDATSTTVAESTRLHPEVVLYVFNCSSTKPLEYKKGQSIVQLFVHHVCESQLQTVSSETPVTVPLRYSS